MDRIPITLAGFKDLEAELKHLKTNERPVIIEQIAAAREHGDLKENAEYHAAREKQSFCEGRIAELENIIAHAEVIDPTKLSGGVKFSAMVEVYDNNTDEEKAYQIVSDYEANLEKGLISFNSPIAKALIGKEEGDIVEFNTPNGKKSYEILVVKYSD